MKYYAGIDLGGTFIKCGIVSEAGEILVKDKIPTPKADFGEVAREMAELVKSLAGRAGVEISGAGVGAPGTVDSSRGVVVYSNNIAWENVPLARAVETSLGVPVRITNDANAAALGESFAGAGRNLKNIVLLTLGTGVGSGIVIDGRLFEGGYSAGAELGHTLIRHRGEPCTCGRRGCFEAYASATALIKQTRRAMELHPESKLWELCDGDLGKVEGKTAFDGANAGDKTAQKVVKDYITYLAEGVINVYNAFRPDAVILGGGVCGAGDALLKPLLRKVKKGVFGGVKHAPVKILISSLGNDAGICGSARLSMNIG